MVTKHAKRRLKQRSGVSKGEVNKVVNRALAEGIKHSEAKGQLRSWMDEEYLKYQTANNCRYYAHKLYIFRGTTLITILDAADGLDEKLRECTDNDKIYITYRKNRYSHKKDPAKEKAKLVTELNTYIPQTIEQKFKELEFEGEFGDAEILDDLSIILRYVPNSPVDEKKVNKLNEYVRDMFGLALRVRLVYSVALPVPNKNRGRSFNYLVETYRINSALLDRLYTRKDIYETRDHLLVFVGSDKYHFPKSAAIYIYEDEEKLFFLREAVGSSNEYSFSICNSSNTLCIFPSEVEALIYLSLQTDREISEMEDVLVLKENKAVLDRYLIEHPNIEKITLCGDKVQKNTELVQTITEKYCELHLTTMN
ncbi:hypothetical protein SAMN02910369_01640 [Lachnospiraceae bacterium NE2001]|nr:hypothetical protein SAMN02910369_01640 [Lachnospiraceae bacterium NE2001]